MIKLKANKPVENCFCQDLSQLKQKLTDHQLLEILKERIKKGTVQFDYDV
jgi:hypothetical protein